VNVTSLDIKIPACYIEFLSMAFKTGLNKNEKQEHIDFLHTDHSFDDTGIRRHLPSNREAASENRWAHCRHLPASGGDAHVHQPGQEKIASMPSRIQLCRR
jgi:hypothetical protein